LATPKPGQRVRGSTTGRPIMAVLDLLGRRWSLRIGWELREGPLPFRELQRRAGMPSPNILTTRLREAIDANLIEKRPDGRYGLTRQGLLLQELMEPLDKWAKGWARDLSRRKGQGS
jgi:DNA-binding HxlR family transcriptional regulator